jgi:hypothetical protein
MVFVRKSVLTSVIIGLGALSACQTSGPSGPGAAPTGVEGAWMSSDGVAISRFAGGSFTTTARDTGKTLAQGSYVISGATISITGTSLIRQSPVSFNCLLVSPRQLNCTSSAGQQFTLVREA